MPRVPQRKSDELDERLEAKQAELSAGAQAKAELLAEFDRLVDPGHSHREALLKVYNKKVKRIKKKENNRGGDDEEDESEEEESDDEDLDDDEVLFHFRSFRRIFRSADSAQTLCTRSRGGW